MYAHDPMQLLYLHFLLDMMVRQVQMDVHTAKNFFFKTSNIRALK